MSNPEPDYSTDIVGDKDYVILKRGDDLMLTQISNQHRIKFFTALIDVSNIIGRPFWSVYKMELVKTSNNNRHYTLGFCDPNTVIANVVDADQSGKDNRSIQDNNNAQALTKDEILKMRNNGQSSQEILQKIVKNSSSFNKKTEFAQEKYLKKKSKKYSDFIQVLKPSIRLLARVLFFKGSFMSPMGLRVETLSQIPTALAFQPDGTYIIYENNCHGLIIAQLLNLLSLNGKLLNIITETYPHCKMKALKAMQFPPEKLSRLVNIRSYFFLKHSTENQTDNDFRPAENPDNEANLKRKNTGDDGGDEEKSKRTVELEKQEDEVRMLSQKKADGLVFACKENVSSEINVMLEYLAPSRPFVVYSQWKEPLVQLFYELRQRKNVIFIRIFENWMRNYQVLPDRTHPETMMRNTSGYLLTGCTIEVINNES